MSKLATLCSADVIVVQVKPERFKDLTQLRDLHAAGVIDLGPASLALMQAEHPPAAWGEEDGRIVRFRLLESVRYVVVDTLLRSIAFGYEVVLWEDQAPGYLENFDPLPPAGPERAAWLRKVLSGLVPIRGHHV